MTQPISAKHNIKNRYQTESTSCSILSCGSTIDELKIQPGEIVLDLGCGRGGDTLEAARQTGSDGIAFGLDLTEAMITEAKESARLMAAENARFVVGDIEDLPFKNEFFHGVTSNCVINHASDKSLVFREICRVLRPDGRFVIADAVTSEPLPQEIKDDPEAWAQCFGGAVTEQEYLTAIRNAGFKQVDILNRREYVKNGFDFISLTIKAVK